ncbi:hypothetical protein [Rhodothermus bifroesti]|uniref:hypothetical protein n=1 Tax=Rhodothermus bifroesti TaxID=2823335 RepID=UPI001AEF5E7B|nr:hypothetical protein [Rhodothermus bifroesti]
MRTLENKIKRSVKGVLTTEAFKNWFQEQKAHDGDLVILNNSFIYRKPVIKTSKNEQYLCLTVKGGQPSTDELSIVKPGDIDSDFKLFSSKSKNLPDRIPLQEAVQQEVQRIGSLVFVLIGELQDADCEVPLNHSFLKSVKYDPAAQQTHVQDIAGGSKAVVVNQLTDPGAAWKAVEKVVQGQVGHALDSLEVAFADAFEKLREEARKRLILPKPGAKKRKTSATLLSRFRASAEQQRKLYSKALSEYSKGGNGADSYLRDAMRVAYNFADDAIKVLELLVSVADLKAVLLWCTIKEHFEVAEAFRNLPWTKSRKKPSLERYREIISGVRNRAFHNLLALDRTVEANLEGIQVSAKRLTLFPPYARRKSHVHFEYEDREMVQVLSELTRAPEATVPLEFWKKNKVVMERFEQLLEATENALWILNKVKGST